MTRYVINNYMTRNIGRFRATATAHDHSHGKCSCGGSCCIGKKLVSRDAHSVAELGIDVKYVKGLTGSPSPGIETRHYSMPGVTVDPRGYPPSPEFVRAALASNRAHKAMLANGWREKEVSGYYKKEHRDVGAKV